MNKLKTVLIFTVVLVLNGCFSIPRAQVLQSSDEDLKTVSSFYLYPIQLGPTLSDATEVSSRLNDLHEKAKMKFAEKAYPIGPVKSADSLIKISIEVDSTGAATDEEIRMMKGAHRSNFPDANPRIRSLEADYLKFEFTRIADNHTLYKSKCRLIENQDALAPAGSQVLSIDDLTSCVDELVALLP